MVTKILLTHNGGLRAKYGAAGVRRLKDAVRRLAAADKARGMQTRLVAIDDGRSAKAVGAERSDDPLDHEAAKRFVDAVFAAWRPDYLVLLGSTDVIPMQPLRNPLFTGDPRRGDPDPTIPSDLPYACEQPFSSDPGRFRGATRVVGRLPDGTAESDTARLERLLAVAGTYRQRRRTDYPPPFAVTAAEWRGSTTLSLQRLLGSADALAAVPDAGPPWPAQATRHLLHFVNCHGGAADWRWYGQRGRSYPIALDATELGSGRALREGTVAAAECCYGGLLYDPAEAGGRTCFADTYLAQGTYGLVAATNVAYGPANGNDSADLVCRFFLQHVLTGCSLGRALLQARQDYVFTKATLSPVDVKTLAQFTLFGDPAVHPVKRTGPAPATGGPTADAEAPKSAPPAGIAVRRRRLLANGEALYAGTTHAATRPVAVGARTRERVSAELAAETAIPLEGAQLQTFEVVSAPAAPVGPDERFHVLLQRGRTGLRAVVAHEEAGQIEQTSVLQER